MKKPYSVLQEENERLDEALNASQESYGIEVVKCMQLQSLNAELVSVLTELIETSTRIAKIYDGNDFIGDMCDSINKSESILQKAQAK